MVFCFIGALTESTICQRRKLDATNASGGSWFGFNSSHKIFRGVLIGERHDKHLRSIMLNTIKALFIISFYLILAGQFLLVLGQLATLGLLLVQIMVHLVQEGL